MLFDSKWKFDTNFHLVLLCYGSSSYTLPTEMMWKNQVKSWNSQVKYQVKKYAKVSALSNQETHYQCLMETKEIRFSMDSADCLRAILFYVIIFPI